MISIHFLPSIFNIPGTQVGLARVSPWTSLPIPFTEFSSIPGILMGFSRNISDSPIFFSPMIWKILFLLIRTEISKKRGAYLIYLGRIDLFFKYVNVNYMVSQKHNLSVCMRVILLSLTWFINIIFSLCGPFLTSAVTEVNPLSALYA